MESGAKKAVKLEPPPLLFFRAPFYFAPLPTIWTPGTGYPSSTKRTLPVGFCQTYGFFNQTPRFPWAPFDGKRRSLWHIPCWGHIGIFYLAIRRAKLRGSAKVAFSVTNSEIRCPDRYHLQLFWLFLSKMYNLHKRVSSSYKQKLYFRPNMFRFLPSSVMNRKKIYIKTYFWVILIIERINPSCDQIGIFLFGP